MTSPNVLTYFEVTGSWQNLELNVPAAIGGDVDPNAEVQNISAFGDFIPRLPVGFTFDVDNLLIQAAQNEIQTIELLGAPGSGAFTLGFNNVAPSTALPFNASAAAVQAALQGLSSIGAGNVSVTGPNGGPWAVEFVGALAATPISTVGAFTADWTGLGAGTGEVEILFFLTRSGMPQISRDTGVHLDTFLARITNGVLVTPSSPTDLPGVHLLANSPVLNFMDNSHDPPVPADLYYDVRFRNVVYGPTGIGNLTNFAILASTDDTPVDLTDPGLQTYPYAPLK
jgi:hypothetical protein